MLEAVGFWITVTSNRSACRSGVVDWWLAEHQIPAQETVISSESKIPLFRRGDIVIDDNPTYMLAALNVGAKVISLRYPYNADIGAYGANLVDDWVGINRVIGFLLKRNLPDWESPDVTGN